MTSKDKKFLITLGSVVLLCIAGLIFWAMQAGKKYTEAQESFASVNTSIENKMNMSLSPTAENQEAKSKALDEFRAGATALANRMKTFRPAEIANTTSQAFTDELVKSVTDVKAAYAEAGLSTTGEKNDLPANFSLGFEAYNSTLAKDTNTGILSFQLRAVTELNKMLAAAKPVRLNSFYRDPLSEEKEGAVTSPAAVTADSVARAMPVEIVFTGKEKAFRTFIEALTNSKEYFYVIRSMRVTNEKQAAPTKADASFTVEAPAGDAAPAADAGGGGFVLPGEAATPAAEATPAAPAAAPAASSEQVLKQVLGGENITVFMRINILLMNADTKVP